MTTTEIKFTDEITVQMIDKLGGDLMITHAAKVSTQGVYSSVQYQAAVEGDRGAQAGLINFLMRKRHGTPFEHSCITFFVHAPIFVWREHHRHRIAFSYNEESGRYKQPDPVFWIPRKDRKMVPVPDPGMECKGERLVGMGDCLGHLDKVKNGLKKCLRCGLEYEYHHSARPCFGPASPEQHAKFCEITRDAYRYVYTQYERLLESGYAKAVARCVLPVGIYSSCWVTCNPRSLMHFISLRIHSPEAMFPSYPQAEIELVARAYEAILRTGWPLTYEAFVSNRYVAP